MRMEDQKTAAGLTEAPAHVGTLSVYEDKDTNFGYAYDISTNAAGHKALQLLDGAELYAVKAGAVPAAPQQAVPPGYNLVPTKLTEEMHVAAVRAIIKSTGNDDFPPAVWAAMIAAAPVPPVPAPVEQAGEKYASISLSGNQLRAALDFINPDGPGDEEQCNDYLYFGVRKHRDDDNKVSEGMCCWNEDTDGVFPLPDEYAPVEQSSNPVPRVGGDTSNLILDRYNAGSLSDHGGGNVDWWWDYMRAELDRAHDFCQSQVESASAPQAERAAMPSDDAIEQAALKHVAIMWGRIGVGGDYRLTEQFARLKAFALEVAAPVAQEGKQSDLTAVDCPVCSGKGLVGGHTGQTPESYEEITLDCDECSGQGKIIVSRKDLASLAALSSTEASAQPSPSNSGSVDTAELKVLCAVWAARLYSNQPVNINAAWEKVIAHIESLIAARVIGAQAAPDAVRVDWASIPTESGLHWYAESAQFPPTQVELEVGSDGALYAVENNAPLGMGFKGKRLNSIAHAKGLWLKISVPSYPASAPNGVGAFSCARAKPGSFSSACHEFCGDNETCVRALRTTSTQPTQPTSEKGGEHE
jgi:hypothetical protein